jgi:hypothetical protein
MVRLVSGHTRRVVRQLLLEGLKSVAEVLFAELEQITMW